MESLHWEASEELSAAKCVWGFLRFKIGSDVRKEQSMKFRFGNSRRSISVQLADGPNTESRIIMLHILKENSLSLC